MKKNEVVFLNLILISFLFITHLSMFLELTGYDLKIYQQYPSYTTYWGRDTLGQYAGSIVRFDYTSLVFIIALAANVIAL